MVTGAKWLTHPSPLLEFALLFLSLQYERIEMLV